MGADLFNSVVLVAVIKHGAVIAAENDERVFGKFQSIEGIEQLTDAPIKFDDRIAARAQRRFSLKPLVNHARHVQVV